MANDLKSIVQRMIDAGEPESNIATVIQHMSKPPEGISISDIPTQQNLPVVPSSPSVMDKNTAPTDVTGFGSHDINKEVPKGDLSGPSIPSMLFPRQMAAQARGATPQQEFGSYAMDVASIPGRAIASIPDAITGGGEGFRKSLGKIEGDSFLGDVVRNPGTAATVATGGLGLIPAVAVGVGSNLIDKASQEKPISPIGTGAEIVGSLALGKAGEKVAGYLSDKIVQKAAQYASGKAWNIVKSVIPDAEKNLGDNQYLFKKYNITGNNAEEVSANINKIVKNKEGVRNSEADLHKTMNMPEGIKTDIAAPTDADLNSLQRIKANIDQNSSIINDKIENPTGMKAIANAIASATLLAHPIKKAIFKGVQSLAEKNGGPGNLGDISSINTLTGNEGVKINSSVNALRKLAVLEKQDGTVTEYLKLNNQVAKDYVNMTKIHNNPNISDAAKSKWMDRAQLNKDKLDQLGQKMKEATDGNLTEETLGMLMGTTTGKETSDQILPNQD